MKIILIVQLVLLTKVYSSPTITGEEVEAAKVHTVTGNQYNSALKKGNSLVENESNFNKNNEQSVNNAKDLENYAGKFHDENYDMQNIKQDNQGYHQHEIGNLEDYGKKLSHKKGHHKSGFHKSYYKDEGGSNSSFYDDSEDEGGELVKRINNINYGDLAQHQYAGAHSGNKYNLVDHNKEGYNNKENNYEKAHEDKQNRISNKYFDAHEGAENKKAFNENNAISHRKSQPEVRRTITVYEDPRVAYRDNNRHYDYPEYGENQRISLEIRDPRDYYDYPEYPLYNDYY